MQISDSVPGLKEAIRKAGLRQDELAAKMGISVNTVSRWVRGESEPPISTVKELSAILNCSVQELLGIASPDISGCRILGVQYRDGKKILTIEIG